jgi:hypothetical protein
MRVATKARLRESPSSLAITGRALCLRQASTARASSGAVRPLAALDLDELANQIPRAALKIVCDGFLLGLQAEPAAALAVSAAPVVRDETSCGQTFA